jgi:hypothetical protein
LERNVKKIKKPPQIFPFSPFDAKKRRAADAKFYAEAKRTSKARSHFDANDGGPSKPAVPKRRVNTRFRRFASHPILSIRSISSFFQAFRRRRARNAVGKGQR